MGLFQTLKKVEKGKARLANELKIAKRQKVCALVLFFWWFPGYLCSSWSSLLPLFKMPVMWTCRQVSISDGRLRICGPIYSAHRCWKVTGNCWLRVSTSARLRCHGNEYRCTPIKCVWVSRVDIFYVSMVCKYVCTSTIIFVSRSPNSRVFHVCICVC